MALLKLLSWNSQKERVHFQVMSDLHLEVCQQYHTFDIVPCAPRLILAGDIGRLQDYEALHSFLHSLCQKFEQVYFVLGNHEFFGVSHQEGLRLAHKLEQESNLEGKLVIMNRKRVDLGDVILLGCTLHSHILPEAEDIVQHKINDFRHIVDWSVHDHNAEHARDVKWLEENINSIREESGTKKRIVIISHHAPSTRGTSRPSDECNPWSSAFATDLIGTKKGSCFDDNQWWIFGHTHYSVELAYGRLKLFSNQRGYVFPNEKRGGPKSAKTWPGLQDILGNNRQRQMTFDPKRTITV